MENCCEVRKTIRPEEDKKQLVNRASRIVGQMNGIKNMLIEDRYCDDILIQLSAVDKAIKSLASELLDRHLHSCVENRLREGHVEVLDEIADLFKRFQ